MGVVVALLLMAAITNMATSTVVKDLCSLSTCICHPRIPGMIIVNCTFLNDQIVDLGPGSVPNETVELLVTGGRQIRSFPGTFSAVSRLDRVVVSRASNVIFSKHAFRDLMGNKLLLDVEDCGTVKFSSMCFNKTRGELPLTETLSSSTTNQHNSTIIGYSEVNVSRCAEVRIEKEPFSLLMTITITDVPDLVLSEGAFIIDSKLYRHGPVTKINLNNVVMKILPTNAFGSTANKIQMTRVEVGEVMRHAFSGNTFTIVFIANSNFITFHEEAFKDGTLIEWLIVKNCTITTIKTKALLSAINSLSFYQNRITEVESNAINATVGNANFSANEIETLRAEAFDLQKWSVITIENNIIDIFERDAFLCRLETDKNPKDFVFRFVNNSIYKVDPRGLSFVSDMNESSILKFFYEKVFFYQKCNCKILDWLHDVLGKNTSRQIFSYNSFCRVDSLIDKCFNMPYDEYMMIRNYTERVCGDEKYIKCDSSKNKGDENITYKPRFPNKRKFEESEKERATRNKKILYLVFLVASCGIIVIVIAMLVRWAKRKGYCIDVKNAIISSNNSCVIFFDRLFNINYGMDTARSISRLSINEYTESHMLNETRILDIDIDPIPVETSDKATQTLPEELTKELLESLREKLDDPENYSEAREMIEHLYDLIKVEECCNTNNNSPCSSRDYPEDDLYDVIQVPDRLQPRNDGTIKTKVSIGTRVPSLDKLLPLSPYTRQTALCHEYSEPRDKAVLPCYSEVSTTRISDISDNDKASARPLSFLRAIGEKMNGNSPKPIASCSGTSSKNLLDGYQKNNADKAHKLANRPLPDEPR